MEIKQPGLCRQLLPTTQGCKGGIQIMDKDEEILRILADKGFIKTDEDEENDFENDEDDDNWVDDDKKEIAAIIHARNPPIKPKPEPGIDLNGKCLTIRTRLTGTHRRFYLVTIEGYPHEFSSWVYMHVGEVYNLTIVKNKNYRNAKDVIRVPSNTPFELYEQNHDRQIRDAYKQINLLKAKIALLNGIIKDGLHKSKLGESE